MKKYKLILGFFALSFCFSNVFGQTKVWIDTDIMIGMPDDRPREVDDGITLIMALKQPNIDIVGISNITYVDYGYSVIQKILNWHHQGEPIPVYKGSPFANDLGKENDATRAMYKALKKEKMTILALGPYTNVATLIKNHPDIIPQIEQIVMCAARTPGLPFDPGNGSKILFDYNYEFDTESMDVILETDIPLAFAGYEPSSYTFIGNVDLEGLDMENEADKWLFNVVQPWMEVNKKYFDMDGFIPFDCSTLAVITHPNDLSYYNDIPIQVNTRENDALEFQPNTPIKKFLEVSYDYSSNRKVKYAYKARHGFEEKIIESLPQAVQKPKPEPKIMN